MRLFTTALLVLLPLSAVLVPRLGLEDLVDGSQFIVHGWVVRSWTGQDAKRRYIWTHHEIAVVEWLRGAPGASLTVSEPGGSLEGVHQGASGSLPYAAGEEVVLFLYRTPAGFLRASGGGQGKFSVGRDGLARPNLAWMEPVHVNGARDAVPPRPLGAMDLRGLKRRVREAAAARPFRALR